MKSQSYGYAILSLAIFLFAYLPAEAQISTLKMPKVELARHLWAQAQQQRAAALKLSAQAEAVELKEHRARNKKDFDSAQMLRVEALALKTRAKFLNQKAWENAKAAMRLLIPPRR